MHDNYSDYSLNKIIGSTFSILFNAPPIKKKKKKKLTQRFTICEV